MALLFDILSTNQERNMEQDWAKQKQANWWAAKTPHEDEQTIQQNTNEQHLENTHAHLYTTQRRSFHLLPTWAQPRQCHDVVTVSHLE